MRLDKDDDIQVAAHPAAHPGVALAGVHQARAGVDAGRNVHHALDSLACPSLAPAGGAGVGDNPAFAPAAGAGGDGGERAENGVLDMAYLAGAGAGRTGLRHRAGLCARPLTDLAALQTRQPQGLGNSERGFFQRDF